LTDLSLKRGDTCRIDDDTALFSKRLRFLKSGRELRNHVEGADQIDLYHTSEPRKRQRVSVPVDSLLGRRNSCAIHQQALRAGKSFCQVEGSICGGFLRDIALDENAANLACDRRTLVA
jgi:hypothetical protein